MRVWAIEDKTAVVVVASYRSVSRNPVRFKTLAPTQCLRTGGKNLLSFNTSKIFNFGLLANKIILKYYSVNSYG